MPAIVQDPESEPVRRVRELIGDRRHHEALALARSLHTAHPDDALLEATLIALESQRVGRPQMEQAYRRAERIVAMHPHLQFPRLVKADLAKELRFTAEALSGYADLLPVAPGPGYIELNIMDTLAMAKRWREAWVHFEKAMALGAETNFMQRNNAYVVGVKAGRRRDAARVIFPLTRSRQERLRLRLRPTQAYQVSLSVVVSSLGLAFDAWPLVALGTASLAFLFALLIPVCEARCRLLVALAALLPPLLYGAGDPSAADLVRGVGWFGAGFASLMFVRTVFRDRDLSPPVVLGGSS